MDKEFLMFGKRKGEFYLITDWNCPLREYMWREQLKYMYRLEDGVWTRYIFRSRAVVRVQQLADHHVPKPLKLMALVMK